MNDGHLHAAGRSLRIGVLGAGGQLGRCLVREIDGASDLQVAFATTRKEIDFSHLEAGAFDALLGTSPDVVVNAAAYTKVDACESEAERAHQINAIAPAAIASILAGRGIRFFHVSTDYVFRGDGSRPYREDDPTDPRTVYGASKRAGELAVFEADSAALIVRTSWVFGPGRNFVRAILDQAAKRRSGEVSGPLAVVDDQLGSPTSAADLASALIRIARGGSEAFRHAEGPLHLRNDGETTWFGFAQAILEEGGYEDVAVEPVTSSAFQTKAPRPAYSVLDCSKAREMGISLRPWRDALASYLAGDDRPHRVQPEHAPDWPAHEVQKR